MITDVYKIELYLNSGWEDVEIDVANDFVKKETLYNNLKPVDSTCSLTLIPNQLIYEKIKSNTSNDIKTRIYKNEVLHFTGYIRKNYNLRKIIKLEKMKVEVVSPSFIMKRKIGFDLNYINKTVSYIIDDLLLKAGITQYTLPAISAVIPGLNIESGKSNYHTLIEDLLFQYGYIGYFNDAGSFITFKLKPDSIVTSSIFNGDKGNCRDEISQSIKEEDKELIEVEWTATKTLYDAIVHSETTNAQNGYKCYIELPPNGYLGGEEEWEAVLNHADGEILSVENLTHSIIKDVGIEVLKFIPNGNKVLRSIKNTNTSVSKFIKKDDIIAQKLVVKLEGSNKSIVVNKPATEKIETVKAEYIYEKVFGDELARILAWYYKYSDYRYKIKSYSDYPIGGIVEIEDSHLGNNTGRIISKKTNEYTGLIEYEVDAIDEYVASDVSNITTYKQPTPSNVVDSIQTVVEAGLNSDGTLTQPINSNSMITDITPTGDGLYLTKDKMGLYYGGLWRSYIQANGNFGFIGDSENFVQWNGTTLEVRGDVEFTGDVALNGSVKLGDSIYSEEYISGNAGWIINGDGDAEFNDVIVRGEIRATSGDIAGTIITTTKLYQGTGNYNSSDTSFYLDNAGRLSLKNKLSFDGTNLNINGNIQSGNITATGGSIAGTTISSTKLYQGTGNFNNTDTFFYLDNAGRLSLKNKLSFDGTNLTINGTIHATSGSFTGQVNATSGSFTGDITSSNIVATGGTIAGWNINTDKLVSATTGSILELSKGLSRISIKNNTDTKVAMGYLNGLAKHKGGTYGPGEYGFWAAPGDKITFDGLVDISGNALSVIDGALILSINTVNGVKETARFGTVSSATGMHFYNTNNQLTSTSIIAGPYSTDSGAGASALQIVTNRNGITTGNLSLGFSTTNGSYYEPTLSINNPLKITQGINVNGNINLLGVSQVIGNVKATWLEMATNNVLLDGSQFVYPWQTTTANPTHVLCESADNASWPSGAGKLTKKKSIPSFVWTLDHSSHSNLTNLNTINQPLGTTSDATFSRLTLSSSYSSISSLAGKTILYKESNGQVGHGTLPSDVCSSATVSNWNTAYTNSHTHSNKATIDGINQELATTSTPTFSTLTVIGKTTVPIGFTYFQLPGKALPSDMFIGTWANVSSQYPGCFFRSEGGEALTFAGGIQTSQNLSHNHTTGNDSPEHTHTMPEHGTGARSPGGGSNQPIHSSIGLGYQTGGASARHTHTVNNSGGSESRPVNYTIRIWERTA